MPPASPQGSRGGLITAVVIFTILFVTATIFAIYNAVQLGKVEEALKQTTDRSKFYYGETSSQTFTDLLAQAKSDPNLPEKTVVAASSANTVDVAKKIMGSALPTTQPAVKATEAAEKAIHDAQTAVPDAAVPDTSLVEAMGALTKYAMDQKSAAAQATLDKNNTVDQAQAAIKKAQDDIASKDAADKVALADKQKTLDDLQAANAAYEAKLKAANDVMDKERQQFNENLAAQGVKLADLGRQLDNEKKAYAAVTEKLKLVRIPPEESIVRQKDGAILTVASDNIVYINLGQGDHILPGLTFEVYSKQDGIPHLGDGMSDTNMPIGEASIEVQQVLGASSQCRVTKLEPGQHIIQGDPIANLVYDRNVKYNFVVFGQFDLNQSGHPNVADADVVKSLVAQWGGKIQPDINVDTDFVVMGAEPKVETFSPDDLKDAFTLNKYNSELAAQKAYQDEIAKAKDLSIPIMNQNRFLYFCGYYDLATR